MRFLEKRKTNLPGVFAERLDGAIEKAAHEDGSEECCGEDGSHTKCAIAIR